MNAIVTFLVGLFVGSFLTALSIALTGASREDDEI